jgi:hypothetical protein
VITTVQPTRPADAMVDANIACRLGDPELWFPHSLTSAEGIRQTETARAVCEVCPARRACLEDILANEGGTRPENRYGIYAGLTPDERFGIHRARVRRAAAAAEAQAC